MDIGNSSAHLLLHITMKFKYFKYLASHIFFETMLIIKVESSTSIYAALFSQENVTIYKTTGGQQLVVQNKNKKHRLLYTQSGGMNAESFAFH